MNHAVFVRGMVRPAVVLALGMQGLAAAMEPGADLGVLGGGLHVRRLVRLDQSALEERDLLRIVELEDVGGVLRRARDQRADDERVRIPLEHHVGVVDRPYRAVLRELAAAVGEDRVAIAGVVRRDLVTPLVLDAENLVRPALAETPLIVAGVDELLQPGVKRLHVIELEIDLQEGLPVEPALVDHDPVEDVTGEVVVGGEGEVG